MKNQNRKVLLILDNAPCHPTMSLSNTNLLFLPANTICKLQPLDLEKIQSFKLHYEHCILTILITLIDLVENVDEVIKKVSLADVVEYIKEAWNSVDENMY